MCIDLHVKYPFSCQILRKLEFSGKSLKKYSNIKFISVDGEPSCAMRKDGQSDMMKLIVAFRNFKNAPQKIQFSYCGRSNRIGQEWNI